MPSDTASAMPCPGISQDMRSNTAGQWKFGSGLSMSSQSRIARDRLFTIGGFEFHTRSVATIAAVAVVPARRDPVEDRWRLVPATKSTAAIGSVPHSNTRLLVPKNGISRLAICVPAIHNLDPGIAVAPSSGTTDTLE